MPSKLCNNPRQNLCNQEKDELYRQYVPLAHRLARNYFMRINGEHGRSLDALTEVALTILADVVFHWNDNTNLGYNPTACKPISWIYRKIYWGLKTECARGSLAKPKAMRFGEMGRAEQRGMVQIAAPRARHNRIAEYLADLGEDARTIVNVICHAPAEIVTELSAADPAGSARWVRAYVTEVEGWGEDRLANAWGQVAACVLA